MGIEIGTGAYMPKMYEQGAVSRTENEVVGTRKSFAEIMSDKPKVPYSNMVKDGVIEYNGVVFIADERTNSLNLGDCSKRSDYITISLAEGGVLNINRECYGEMKKCMDMFSSEDKGRIMRAINQNIQIARKGQEIDEMEDEIGEKIL